MVFFSVLVSGVEDVWAQEARAAETRAFSQLVPGECLLGQPKHCFSHFSKQFGLFDVPTIGASMDSDGGDSDLEAELAALSGGASAPPKPKKVPTLSNNV